MIPKGTAVIGEDLIVQGELRSAGDIEVLGYVAGVISAARLTVHPSGRVHGTIRAETADVNGMMQGTIAVRRLIDIGETGRVSGNVRYGQLAMARGAELSADMHNVPPELAGDFALAVRRGRSVRITTEDLQAVDPDSSADDLEFAVTRPIGGHIVHSHHPETAIEFFSQRDLEDGNIYFLHDGGDEPRSSIDVSVQDQTGANSGTPQTLHVAVIPQ